MATTHAVTTKKADLLPAPLLSVVQGLMPDVYRLLPPDITDEQFRAACWLEITGRKDLHDCVLESIRDSIIDAANKGLMPGRDCHFLPFKQKKYGGRKGSTCVSNYFGIIRTLDRSGKVRRSFAHPVHEGDEWGFDMFQDRPIHKPAVTLGKKQGKELFYYGAIMFHDGTCAFEVLTLDDLDSIRKRAPSHENGPWVSDPVMMKRKSALKRVAKYVQLTPEQRRAIDEDDARELEDIPSERHRKNITDLFGKAPEDEGETTAVAKNVTPKGKPSQAGSGDSDRDSAAWDTLRAHQGDAALPMELLEQIDAALSPLAPANSLEAHNLAEAVLDWLSHNDEDNA